MCQMDATYTHSWAAQLLSVLYYYYYYTGGCISVVLFVVVIIITSPVALLHGTFGQSKFIIDT